MVASVLTSDEITSFEKLGYVRLSQAFSPESALMMQDFMWDELKRAAGIDRADRSTWTNPWQGLSKIGRHNKFKGVGSPRMYGAIDQLLGQGAWREPKGWGGFLITPPQGTDKSWDIAKDWHWDGDPGHHVDGLSGLSIFTFYSHVKPRGGGTLIVEGSHRLVMSFFHNLVPNHLGRKRKGLIRAFSQSHPWLTELTGHMPDSHDRVRRFVEEKTVIDDVAVRVVELTGEPGDAVICHPAIYHSSSYNCSNVTRFMRTGGVKR